MSIHSYKKYFKFKYMYLFYLQCANSNGVSWLEPTNGEGIISEERFVITGVVEHNVASMRPPRVKE